MRQNPVSSEFTLCSIYLNSMYMVAFSKRRMAIITDCPSVGILVADYNVVWRYSPAATYSLHLRKIREPYFDPTSTYVGVLKVPAAL